MQKNPYKQIFITTIISIILVSIDFGEYTNLFSPIWILIFFAYFLLNFNLNYQYLIALILGLIIDIVSGNILGVNALALIVSSYFTSKNKHTIKIANNFTIAIFIALITIIYLSVVLIIHIIIQGFDFSYLIFITPITTAIFYPIISQIMLKYK